MELSGAQCRKTLPVSDYTTKRVSRDRDQGKEYLRQGSWIMSAINDSHGASRLVTLVRLYPARTIATLGGHRWF